MIKSILLGSFGHFKDRRIYFTSGLNLIYAGNEEGKTTLFKALEASLLGFIPAGRNYPYFPWDGEELYLEAELFDGRKLSRRINSSITGFIEEEGEIEVLANRPLDGLSRYYVENFHLLEAEGIYQLKSSSVEDLIEDYIEKLYQAQGNSFRSVLKLIEERKKEIYKKRGSNFLLYGLEKELYELERKQLLKNQALEKKTLLLEKQAELEAKANGFERGELDRKEEELAELDKKIQVESQEMAELKRLEELRESMKLPGLLPFSLALGLLIISYLAMVFNYINIKIAFILAVLSIGLGLLYLYIYRHSRLRLGSRLASEGFFSLKDFRTSYRLQSSLDFELDELLKKRSSLIEELREARNLSIRDREAKSQRLLELKVELSKLDAILDEDLEDYSQLLKKKEELTESYNRYSILGATLEASYNQYRRELLPEILDRASFYLRAFTQNSYLRILQGEEESFFLQSNKGNFELTSSMSKGLRSQFYLALRLAFIDRMNRNLPIFYDEAFSNWDEPRLIATLKIIQELARQQFIFTCREKEAQLYEDVLGIKRIEL